MRGALILAAPDQHRALAPTLSFARQSGLRSSTPSVGLPLPTSKASLKSKGYDVQSHSKQDADARCAMSMTNKNCTSMTGSLSLSLAFVYCCSHACVFQSNSSSMSISDFSPTKSDRETPYENSDMPAQSCAVH